MIVTAQWKNKHPKGKNGWLHLILWKTLCLKEWVTAAALFKQNENMTLKNGLKNENEQLQVVFEKNI